MATNDDFNAARFRDLVDYKRDADLLYEIYYATSDENCKWARVYLKPEWISLQTEEEAAFLRKYIDSPGMEYIDAWLGSFNYFEDPSDEDEDVLGWQFMLKDGRYISLPGYAIDRYEIIGDR